MTIPERLSTLRATMAAAGIDACIIPSSDPHQSEYVAECWKYREYMSGFTGSAGTLVIGSDDAGLWTDSRYFLQAEVELEGTGIRLFKASLPETALPEAWMADRGYRCVGLDGNMFSAKDVRSLEAYLAPLSIGLRPDFEPYVDVWPDRPAFPGNEMYAFPVEYAGEAVRSKLQRLREILAGKGTDAMPLSCLDEVAWLFNLRGSDIEYNPLGIAHAYVDQQSATLFTDPAKLSKATLEVLKAEGVDVMPYDALPGRMAAIKRQRLLVDPSRLSHRVCSAIDGSNRLVEAPSPVARMKALKNEVEVAGFQKAMVKDGIALTRFVMELEKSIAQGGEGLTEWSIARRIAELRGQQEHYVCDSFGPIVSYNDHGAIVHYEVSPESAYPVKPGGILLTDTGGQYFDGTTDITRTFSLYEDTPELYREDYTSLLKGVIALSTAVFPTNTRGVQLDVLARQYIWKRGVNYLHGTGHGVGHFLNVHEGPHSVRMNENPVVLEAGMTLTNEPAIYRTGQWGVRVENVMLVREHSRSEFGDYLCFDVLTLFPLDPKSIKVELLSAEEIDWVDRYHRRVYDTLSPLLSDDECRWLQEKTQPLHL